MKRVRGLRKQEARMFTMEERDQVRERVLAMARTAAQVTADAFVRSFAR